MRRLLLATACVLAVLAASAVAAQEGGVNFVAEPVAESRTDPTGGYFLLEARPGEQITQAIGLRNDSDRPMELRLAAVDAVTAQLGGASYALGTETASRTGAWITLERMAVTLAPKASATVSFQVLVPPDAQSGHHLAGISISAPKGSDGSPQAGTGQAGASVDVQTRRIIAVQVNLPGPAEPALVVGGVAAVARPDGLHLEIAIDNEGTALTKATGVINVGDDFQRDFDVDTFVPGTSIAYPVRWTEAAAEDGEYPARVELRYGDHIARWEGSFLVGEELLDDLADRQVIPSEAETGDEASGPPPVVLVGGVVVAAVLVGVGSAVLRLRRPVGRHSRKR